MKLLIAIVTYKRILKLQRCLDSICKSTYNNCEIVIIADNNDKETSDFVSSYSLGGIKTLIQPEHKFVVGAWNRAVQEVFIKGNYDGFIGFVDDIELNSDALEKIVVDFENTFWGTDGVIGFRQECYGIENYTYKPYGQMLIGKQFIERYKVVDYMYYAPMYKHFYADEELYNYAKSLNKFYLCYHAILQHDHPNFTGNLDKTHNIIRKGINSPKEHDIKVFKRRQKEGKTWGKTWEL